MGQTDGDGPMTHISRIDCTFAVKEAADGQPFIIAENGERMLIAFYLKQGLSLADAYDIARQMRRFITSLSVEPYEGSVPNIVTGPDTKQ